MSSSQEISIPFPGLRSFREIESNIFFGRREQVCQLLEHLYENKLLAVIGTSGSGKSSLIRAGLISYLHAGFMGQDDENWRIIELRPTKCLITDLAQRLPQNLILNSAHIEFLLRQSSKGLYQIISQLRMPVRQQSEPTIKETECILILIDQFEEIFRLRQEAFNNDDLLEELSKFVDLLLNVVEYPEAKTYVIITMRSDFLESCSQFRNLPEAISRNAYLVPQMNREQIQDVIREPVRGKISSRLVSKLINDIAHTPDQLPVLQHTLRRTWQNWYRSSPRAAKISEEHYQEIGGIENALSNHADEVYEGLDNKQKIAELLFKCITGKTKDGKSIRISTSFYEILNVAQATNSKTTKQDLLAVIEAFRHPDCCFIAPFVEAGEIEDASDIDISHESLMRLWGRLRAWIDEEAEKVQDYLALAKRCDAYQNEKGDLLSDRALSVALRWRDSQYPNEAWAARCSRRFGSAVNFTEVIAFLEESRKTEEAKVKQAERERQEREEQQEKIIKDQKNKIVFGSILLSIISILLILLFLQFKVAKKAQLIALSSSSEANLSANHQLEALVESLKAGQELRNTSLLVDPQTKLRVLTVLQKVVYETRERNRLVKVHKDWIRATAFSRSGEIFVSGSRDGEIKVWNRKYSSANTINNGAAISSVTFNPDEETLAVAGEDGTIKLWNIRTGKKIVEFSKQKDPVTSVDFSPDGTTLISAAARTITLWDRRGRKIRAFGGQHRAQINRVKFSPNGKIIASASDDQTVRIWNIESKEIYPPKLNPDQVTDLAFSPDGTKIAAAAGNKIQVWAVSGQKASDLLEGTGGIIYKVAFSPGGKTIASANKNGSIDIWDRFEESVEPLTLLGHSGAAFSVNFSPDGKTIASAGEDQTIIFWNANGAEAVTKHTQPVFKISFSPDGRTLASASKDRTVNLWDIDDNNQKILSHAAPVRGVSFSPDGKEIASVDDKGILKLWNRQGKFINSFQAYSQGIRGVDFSPDGTMIATASEDGVIKLWDRSGKPLGTFQEKGSLAIGIAFSPTGQTIASAHESGSIKLWDYKGNLKLTINTGEGIHSVRFGSNGKIIVSLKNQVKLWGQFGKPIGTALPIQHNGDIWDASFSPDGQMIVSVGQDTSTRIWSLDGKLIQTFHAHHDTLFSAAFSSDRDRVASASKDGKVVVWDLGLESLLDKGCNRIRDYLAAHHDIDICQN